MSKIGVLAVQGAFAEHEAVLRGLGAQPVELRERKDLEGIEGLVLPGGESTVQGKLLTELGMMEPLKAAVASGLPVLATCAGLILLAEKLENDPAVWLGTMPVVVRRNAYGRQLGSFTAEAPFKGLGTVEMIFIRAPEVVSTGPGVETLATVNGRIAAVAFGNQIGLAFHPELGRDSRIHALFLERVHAAGQRLRL
ncbi:pyridoxal 5'-phosphate synthase glutaminase subunit PdxT [Mesosutterella sp. AGMB02718]|uniref:Pyridoxal 5'-phosphate synthase subunit PdxT n=1 Tax=Mesosutterella faecium TaxID=2925194 RepID=A0ABT7IQ28_9BURK|nr:pyridoxal 5'-phosphate synthase glutaminase subunit PdxT [Mesosutterella sp. AGMB02718]MDL2059986.1 pyridoxal 5'-phosphate synthase glutaminase subunit PdxT [Mesosutterella sp. AGMB02718]